MKDLNWDEWGKDKDKPGRLSVIGKGDKERIITLPSHLMEKLKLYFLTYTPKMDEKMFKLSGSSWTRVMATISKQALGRTVKSHTLRHTRTTNLWRSKKLDIIHIKEFLGHASIMTTEHYIHPNQEEALAQMEKFIVEEEKK